jgi:hypothetical protein
MSRYRVVKENGVQMGQNCVLGVPMTQPPTEFYFDRDRRAFNAEMRNRLRLQEAEMAARRAIVQNQIVKPAMVHTLGVVNQQQAHADFLKGRRMGWWRV